MPASSKAVPIAPDAIFDLLAEWQDQGFRLEADADKHRIRAISASETLALRLPLDWPVPTEREFDPETYFTPFPIEEGPYLVVLVQLGAAALGLWEDGEWMAHKAIKKYMKRHKRGKAQISYLNTRGKSKAGSRIRLANTVAFFEEINERLQDLDSLYEPTTIMLSCTAQVWGLLFQAKTLPPFEKKDLRLRRIPHNVHIPDFAELQRVQGLVSQGWILPVG